MDKNNPGPVRPPAPNWVWLAFVACLVVAGWPFWTLAYNQINLPSSLLGPGLGVVVLSALLARATGATGGWRALHMFAVTVPMANMVRISFDVARDPTTHNLFPFELAISAMTGYGCAAVGVLAGSLLLWLNKARRSRGS